MAVKVERRVGPARSWAHGSMARLLPALILTSTGCGLTREAEDVRAMPAAAARFAVEAPCSAPAAQSAVEGAARELELDVEEASQKPGAPWVLRRGPRLVDPPLFYRVDIVAAPDQGSAAVIRVYAVPVSRLFSDTHETIAKPASLAMRIVATCAAGGAR